MGWCVYNRIEYHLRIKVYSSLRMVWNTLNYSDCQLNHYQTLQTKIR